MKEVRTIFYYFLLSIIATFLILMMVFLQPIIDNKITIFDKFFVAAVFFTSCTFGITIAIYPNWWRKNKRNTNHTSNLQKIKTSRSFKGHHPDCSMFRSHIVIISNKPRCAGCLGLTIGTLISIFLMIFYLIFPVELSLNLYYILFLIGIFVLFFVYGEIMFFKRKNFLHILLNILFILSFFAITISVLEITKNLLYATITIVMCFLWLNTRILFSKYQHMKICFSCIQECKSY